MDPSNMTVEGMARSIAASCKPLGLRIVGDKRDADAAAAAADGDAK
jgi:hypothetical protein